MLNASGFNTSKGDLLRSIMFPKSVDFKFTRDSYYYVGALFVCAMAGMIYTVIVKVPLF